ncbi:MAG: UDP-N-acetylmuramate-alanine ligase, partial [Planctomycetota bacterium]
MSAEDDSLVALMKHFDDALSVDQLVAICRRSDALLHFVGIAGAGMSALADFRLQAGGRVSGSDRFFDQGNLLTEKGRLQRLGANILRQNGENLENVDLMVASTAVEAQIPDLIRAQELGIPVVHRAQLLAAHVSSRPTIAIAGTSGKSTVVGMTFSALRGAGLDPGVITGGE